MKLLKQLLGITKVAGVEFTLLGEGKFYCNVVVVSINNNKLKVENKFSGVNDLSELKRLVSTEIPLAISVTGRGIINKKVVSVSDESEDILINSIFPNSKTSDFFLQKFIQRDGAFLSLIRKETLNNFLSDLNKLGFNIVGVNLGSLVAGNVLKLINFQQGQLELLNSSLVINDFEVKELKTSDGNSSKRISLGDQVLESSEIIPFASAFSTLIESDFVGLTCDEIIKEKQEYIHKKVFKLAGFSTLLFFFVLLLINYLCFLHFKDQNSLLTNEAALYTGAIKELNELESKVKEKEYFLKQAGWLTIPKNSFYADEIAGIIPSTIKLKELKINPVNEKLSKETKVLSFKKDTILVIGNCASPTDLNPWMEEFKTKDWVDDVKNKGYSHDYKLREGMFKFEATIKNHE